MRGRARRVFSMCTSDEVRMSERVHILLEAFFTACDERESGEEPDWEAHREMIERSIRSGSRVT